MKEGTKRILLILGLVLAFAGVSGAVSDPFGMTWFDAIWIIGGVVLIGLSIFVPRKAHS